MNLSGITARSLVVETSINLAQRLISSGLIKDPIMHLLSKDLQNAERAGKKGGTVGGRPLDS